MKECLCSSRVAANSLHTDFSELLHTILVLYNWLLSKLAYYCQKHFGTGNFMRQSGKFDFSISKQGGIRLDFSVYSNPTIFLHIRFTVWKTKHLLSHSVEKYTKKRSRWKIFREITHQKSANSTFTNACFSTLRRHFCNKMMKCTL